MSSIWLSECDPEELRATCPHHPCGRDGDHDAHAWRGSTRPAKFGGVCEGISTYWREGQDAGEWALELAAKSARSEIV